MRLRTENETIIVIIQRHSQDMINLFRISINSLEYVDTTAKVKKDLGMYKVPNDVFLEATIVRPNQIFCFEVLLVAFWQNNSG